MRTLVILVTVAALASCNAPANKEVSLTTFSDSASYAVGTTLGSNLKSDFEVQKIEDEFNKDVILAGMAAALKGDSTKLSKEDAEQVMNRFFEDMNKRKAEANKKAGEDFLAENGAKAGVVTTESGLQYIVLKEGEGDSPTAADQVVVHYSGKLTNGEIFDSSYERNEPVTFYVRSVIPGWTEALQLMKPGAEYKLFIPSDLAYGEGGQPRGGIGPNEVLIFDVKLIDVVRK
ncbi:MAG: FKBP-type peptidyl-prolyl cis-trans isomerase [Flavobacteriales bacterium]|nr:FKBP-type peptidyl-prolyl cis-trans isomerase [Flavobacteriales bacterium]